jgi:hypothetical protein
MMVMVLLMTFMERTSWAVSMTMMEIPKTTTVMAPTWQGIIAAQGNNGIGIVGVAPKYTDHGH